ncbi:MAG: hypothetical protein ORO03_04445, partial [Alphaproteobacteria bacterium]|nr:hypothetical protein [Alphaproteobacteria bacterium]
MRGFTERSGRRLVDYLNSAEVDYRTMGTLTYRGDHWRSNCAPPDAKRHLDALVKRLKRKFHVEQGDQFALVWFIEFTASGVPHFHFFCTEFIPYKWLALAWFEIVEDADVRHLSAGTRIE